MAETSSLTPTQRHRHIISILQRDGAVSVCDLSALLNVSEVTIRKDLSLLEKKKELYRAHGTAILISPYISDRHVSEKEKQNVAQKRAICAYAAHMITPNDSIIIASGTTMIYFARAIKAVGNLTVITAAVQVTSILSQNKDIEVYQLGGAVRSSSMSVTGNFAEEMLRSFHCSKLFIGADGIDPDFGVTTTNVMEASVNRAMINASQKVVLLADSTKFGRRGFSKICDFDNVDEIITDSNISPKLLQLLQDKGVVVTIVKVDA